MCGIAHRITAVVVVLINHYSFVFDQEWNSPKFFVPWRRSEEDDLWVSSAPKVFPEYMRTEECCFSESARDGIDLSMYNKHGKAWSVRSFWEEAAPDFTPPSSPKKRKRSKKRAFDEAEESSSSCSDDGDDEERSGEGKRSKLGFVFDKNF